MVIFIMSIPLALCCTGTDECLESERKPILEWDPMPPDDSCTKPSQGEYIVNERLEIVMTSYLITVLVLIHKFPQNTDDSFAVIVCQVEIRSCIHQSLKYIHVLFTRIFLHWGQKVKRSLTPFVDGVHISSKMKDEFNPCVNFFQL